MLQPWRFLIQKEMALLTLRDTVFAGGRVSYRTETSSLRSWRPALQKRIVKHLSFKAASLSDARIALPDLYHQVPSGDHWEVVRQWVVFSDLHVNAKTVKVRRLDWLKLRHSPRIFQGTLSSSRRFSSMLEPEHTFICPT